jgi:hypothetical protein
MACRLSAAVVSFERRRHSCQWVVAAAAAGATQPRRFLFSVPVVPHDAVTLRPTLSSARATAALIAATTTAAMIVAGSFSATWWLWYGQDSNAFQHQRMGASTKCEEYLPNFGSSSDPIAWHVPREDHEESDGEPMLVLRPLEHKTCRLLDGSPAEHDHPDSKSVRAFAASATQFLDRMIEPYDSETTVSSSDPNTVSPKSVLLATTEAQQQQSQQVVHQPTRVVQTLLDLHHHDDKSNIVTTRKMYFFHSPEIESWRAEKVRLRELGQFCRGQMLIRFLLFVAHSSFCWLDRHRAIWVPILDTCWACPSIAWTWASTWMAKPASKSKTRCGASMCTLSNPPPRPTPLWNCSF